MFTSYVHFVCSLRSHTPFTYFIPNVQGKGMFAKYLQDKVDDTPSSTSFPPAFDTARRTSVSAECWNCPQDARQTPRPPKRAATSTTLKSPPTKQQSEVSELCAQSLRSSIFFEELSDRLMAVVLEALVEKSVDANVDVIKQGDEGNELFILHKGKVEFVIDGVKKGEASNGALFGELALLYNSPRAATVRTLMPSSLFVLDRITFKRIMVAKLTDKRLHSQQLLASIEAFRNVPEQVCLRISDALHPVTFKKNDIVFKEGDPGMDFYLIDEGSVSVLKGNKVVNQHRSGEYFGELALIYDHPRAATIQVTSETLKLEVLSKKGFEQLIGPDLVAELRRRDPRNAK